MDGGDNNDETNWSETVEDLVLGGQTDKAISFLETLISNLETQSHLSELSTLLFDLSKLYSTKGLSLKADQTYSRALTIQQQLSDQAQCDLKAVHESKEYHVSRDEASTSEKIMENGNVSISSNLLDDNSPTGVCSDDDWEAAADRAPEELLSTQDIPDVSNISLKDKETQTIKRRGRGTFAYKKQGLYSDQQFDDPAIDISEDEVGTDDSQDTAHGSQDTEIRNLKYGTRHVLVLADFPPSTRTTDLEKLLEAFKDRVAIRWVNDTVALAVFGTPSIAREACNSLQCSFKVRILDNNDDLLSSISPRDLEPPRPRPKTSARAANRLIANVMGLKLPSSSFGAKELRQQEEARRKRIVSRQNMKDDAWGED
ncbi:Coiled-coil domain-containing protein R3HCC1L [Heracleum sosnowskyi]|uniref:Coiled-coil domain-containing protein R3HCC1L n=1 Tax=Heracleum sosnowskyi TaxID=360622 RepID=A0AAD8ILE0_9APIA|nr:Coiled-coil domain-containing protein R3HCC1L [Heracleum sosnowskyi]